MIEHDKMWYTRLIQELNLDVPKENVISRYMLTEEHVFMTYRS